MLKFINRSITAILILPIRIYQLVISPLFPPSCRYYPSCSSYAVTALKQYGPFLGFFMGTKRIISCNPWGGQGYDPVPKIRFKRIRNLKTIEKPVSITLSIPDSEL